MTAAVIRALSLKCFACETFAPHRVCFACETSALSCLAFREVPHGKA